MYLYTFDGIVLLISYHDYHRAAHNHLFNITPAGYIQLHSVHLFPPILTYRLVLCLGPFGPDR